MPKTKAVKTEVHDPSKDCNVLTKHELEEENNAKVLVTGGAGFIGSHLVVKLIEKGHFTIVLDNLYSGKMENLAAVLNHPNFRFVRGDVRDLKVVSDAFCGVDRVIHLAALIDVSASVADPIQTHEINATGTLNVLLEAARRKVRKFVFASSTAVYGDVKRLPLEERIPLRPISPYGASKTAGESYCHSFAACFGLNVVSLRFFNVYGDRNENSPYSGVITKFLKQIMNGEALTVEGDGAQSRDFVHVNDVVEAILLALENPRVKGKVFNICTGVSTSIKQLVNTLNEVTGKDLQIVHKPSRTGDIQESYGDTGKAALELGFRSKVGLKQGLEMLLRS